MTEQEFYSKYKAYAQKASAQLGIPYETILAFWSWETSFGTNEGTKYNNLGGIKYVGARTQDYKAPTTSGMYAGYNTLDRFVEDYVRVLKLSYYDKVREAGTTTSYQDDIEKMNESPYAEADYNVNSILTRINNILKLGGTTNKSTIEEAQNKLQSFSSEKVGAIALGVLIIALTLKE